MIRVRSFHLIFLLTIFISGFITDAFSQKGYISGDNFKKSGLLLKDEGAKNNSHFIKVDYKDSIVTYTPSTIAGYGFINGNNYESKTILMTGEPNSVFLEILTSGPTKLYFYPLKHGRIFFLQQDSGKLIPLKRKSHSAGLDFKKELAGYLSPCKGSDKLIHAANYTKGYLTCLVKTINNDCDRKYLPFIKFGFLINTGTETLKITRNNELNNDLVFKPENRVGFGGFISVPFWPYDFSSYSELYFEHTSLSGDQIINGNEISIDVECSALNLPLMIRYTVPSRIFRPFLNAGLMYSLNYNIIKADLERPSFPNPVHDIYALHQFSLLGGAGFEIPFTARNAIITEFRYSWGVITDNSKFFRDQFNFTFGINF